MEASGGWRGEFPINQSTSFGLSFDTGQNLDDWEDWLRWDPTLEPTSPEEGTLNSASSKNDSPIQNAVLPADGELFGKNETLAPPLILGDDAMDLSQQPLFGDNDTFVFGNLNDSNDFDFQSDYITEQLHPPMTKIDTSVNPWPLVSTLDTQNISLSALSNNNYQTVPSTGNASSNPSSLHYSPESTTQNRTSISSNSPEPPKKKRGRKRKIDIEQEQREQHGESQEDGDGDGEGGTKTSHNVIEKRYRTNLNDKIVELRNAVPSLRAMGRANRGDGNEDLDGLTPAHKLNKATVMAKATEYIRHLEKRNKLIADEMDTLKARMVAAEATFAKSRDRGASISSSPPAAQRSRQTSAASQNGAQGFLNSSQEQARMNQQIVQQQYMQSQHQPNYVRQPGPAVDAQNQPQYVNGRGGGGIMNKVVVGTMAAFMVMEGFSESRSGDESSNRALFSMPTGLLKRGTEPGLSSPPAIISRQAALPLLKLMLVVGALLYLLAPLLSFSTRKKQKLRTSTVRLPHSPSLASPIEVRRKAWLTAVQTVWVPKHFLLEVVAVTSKMISLSVRRLIGLEAFNSLTGANKDDEVARIKAWDIAIDAQLAGGDQEVSYYRLLLTLMESGTLPDSPTRLMQKAVHFRVFFWEVANAGYGNMMGFKQFTERVGRFYWESARRQQKELVHAKAQGRPIPEAEDEVDMLPDHLARLVELDCDDVLSDEMIQRAWNLAWNKPSAYRTTSNVARDAVIEDHAIRSPMDAVAAWYASMTVDDTLAESLHDRASTLDVEYYVGLAVSVAPPASATVARALAAKAILSNGNRNANILAALDALPAGASNSGELNVVNHVPATPDVRTALTIAKLLALSSPQASITAQRRALDATSAIQLPPAAFSLLTAVATYRLLKTLTTNNHRLPPHAAYGLGDLATSLRVWIGTSSGQTAGLDSRSCGQIVDRCLNVAKKVGGWDDRDSGYGSAESGSPVEGSPVRRYVDIAI